MVGAPSQSALDYFGGMIGASDPDLLLCLTYACPPPFDAPRHMVAGISLSKTRITRECVRSTLLEGPLPNSDTIAMHCAAECHEYVMVDIVDSGDTLDDEEGGWASPSTDSDTTPEKASSGNQVHSLGQHAPTFIQLIFSLLCQILTCNG